MFWSKNKKDRYTPASPSFFYMKVGYKGVSITWICYPDVICRLFFKVNVGNDKEVAQSETNFPLQKLGGKRTKLTLKYYSEKTYRRPLSHPNLTNSMKTLWNVNIRPETPDKLIEYKIDIFFFIV